MKGSRTGIGDRVPANVSRPEQGLAVGPLGRGGAAGGEEMARAERLASRPRSVAERAAREGTAGRRPSSTDLEC